MRLAAQAHLARFYGSMGFVVDGPEHDEDGIPHVIPPKPVDPSQRPRLHARFLTRLRT